MKKMLENGLLEYNIQVPYKVKMNTGFVGEDSEETLLAELAEFGGALSDYIQYNAFPQSIVKDGEEMLESHKESYGHEYEEDDWERGEVNLTFYTCPDVPPEDVSFAQGIPVYSDMYGLWVLLQVGDAHNQLMELTNKGRTLSSENRTMKSNLSAIARLSEGY